MRLAPPDRPLSDGVVALRQWREADAGAIAEACRDPEITRWLDQIPQPFGLVEAREYLAACRQGWEEGAGASFAVLDAAGGHLLGSLGIRLAGRTESPRPGTGRRARRAAAASPRAPCGSRRAGSSGTRESSASSSGPKR